MRDRDNLSSATAHHQQGGLWADKSTVEECAGARKETVAKRMTVDFSLMAFWSSRSCRERKSLGLRVATMWTTRDNGTCSRSRSFVESARQCLSGPRLPMLECWPVAHTAHWLVARAVGAEEELRRGRRFAAERLALAAIFDSCRGEARRRT